MKICSSCNKELIDEAKFCSECGNPTEIPKKLCANCQSELESDAKFCIECGTQACILPSDEEKNEVLGAPAPEACEQAKPNKVNYVLSLAFAVPALVCAVLSASDIVETLFFWFPSMFIFLILSKVFTRKYYMQCDTENGYIKAARILTKIALPVGIVFAFFCAFTEIVSFLTSPFFIELVEEIITYFNDTVYDLLAK